MHVAERQIESWFVKWDELAYTVFADPRIVLASDRDVVVDLAADLNNGAFLDYLVRRFQVRGLALAPTETSPASATDSPLIRFIDYTRPQNPQSISFHTTREATVILAVFENPEHRGRIISAIQHISATLYSRKDQHKCSITLIAFLDDLSYLTPTDDFRPDARSWCKIESALLDNIGYPMAFRHRANFVDAIREVAVMDLAPLDWLEEDESSIFIQRETGNMMRTVCGTDYSLLYDTWRRGDDSPALSSLRRSIPSESDDNKGPTHWSAYPFFDVDMVLSHPGFKRLASEPMEYPAFYAYSVAMNVADRPHLNRTTPGLTWEDYAQDVEAIYATPNEGEQQVALENLHSKWSDFLQRANLSRYVSEGLFSRALVGAGDLRRMSRFAYNRHTLRVQNSIPSLNDLARREIERLNGTNATLESSVSKGSRDNLKLNVDGKTGQRGLNANRELSSGKTFARFVTTAWVPLSGYMFDVCHHCGKKVSLGTDPTDISCLYIQQQPDAPFRLVQRKAKLDGVHQFQADLDENEPDGNASGVCGRCGFVAACGDACWKKIRKYHCVYPEHKGALAPSECDHYASAVHDNALTTFAFEVDVVRNALLEQPTERHRTAEVDVQYAQGDDVARFYTALRMATRAFYLTLLFPEYKVLMPMLITDSGNMSPDELALTNTISAIISALSTPGQPNYDTGGVTPADIRLAETALHGTCAGVTRNAIDDVRMRFLCVPMSMLNHSCDPNARIEIALYENALPQIAVKAMRDIGANEEITISYSDSLKSYRKNPNRLTDSGVDLRKTELLMGWGFDCRCPVCQKEDALWEEELLADFTARPQPIRELQ